MCQGEPARRTSAGRRGLLRESRHVARILRGEIRWADLNPVRGHEQAGERPVLVLRHDVFNERSGTVIAVALTSQEPRAGFPLTLEIRTGGLPKRSWVKISQIRTLSTERIGRRLARASDEDLVRIVEGLNEILGSSSVRLFRRPNPRAP